MQSPIPAEGSTLWIRQRPWQVERVRLCAHIVRLDVRNSNERLTFLAPFDRLTLDTESRRPTSVRLQNAAARLAHLSGQLPRWTSVNVARTANIDLHDYQLEPWLAVLHGTRRVLLADAVGLGKTIQAGLVLAELAWRKGSIRALVICPATLRAQWVEELTRRFSLTCQIADRHSLAVFDRTNPLGDSPWKHGGVWIASVDYLKQPYVLEGLPCSAWDALVIDEAHEVCGSTERHEACDEIARRAHCVLMLTATPHSGDTGRFERLLAIGQMAGDAIVVFRRTRQDAHLPSERRVRWLTIRQDATELRLLQALQAYERAVIGAAGRSHAGPALLLLSVFRKRALSTMTALSRSLARRLEWLEAPERLVALDWMQPALDFEEADDDLADSERSALCAHVGMRHAEERNWIRRLLALTLSATTADGKERRLSLLVSRTSEPVVVFTEFRDSLDALRRNMPLDRDVAVLHGGQPMPVRREQLRRFECGESSVLIATDVAGQGLNLQRAARWVINLELPWNPTRVEQRIGRVDRIGQRRPVHATLLVSRHPAESTLLASLARRTLAAQQALGPSVTGLVGAPAELALAERLIGHNRTEVPTTPIRIVLCTGFQRRARALASVLTRRRLLTARWKADALNPRPGLCRFRAEHAAVRQAPELSAARCTIGVFDIPILDRSCRVLERHLLVVSGLESRRSLGAVALEAIHAIAVRAFAARRKRLVVLIRQSQGVPSEANLAIGRRLAAMCRPDETQPELFSRASLDAFERGRLEADRLIHRHDEADRHARGLIEISIGRPVLRMLVEPVRRP